ncbi:MAG: hypothetical protein M3Y08_11635 [Fibrobacterota bacterium]|nr:hypothetical protein [Fibrobacterota bacterium]
MAIPNRLIFIWFGREFPYGNILALRSAQKQCRPDEILLVVDHPNEVLGCLGSLAEWPEMKIVRASPDWFEDLPPGGTLASEVFEKSSHAPTKSNLLRLAVLYHSGGVYLDFDTITVRDLSPLRQGEGFFGLERVVFPFSFLARKNPLKWISAGLLLLLRELCARLPGGWKIFRRMEGMYPLAANNAIFGFEPRHPFLARCFLNLTAVPRAQLYRRFRLGTHLLQEVSQNQSGQTISAHPPSAFFPLGPEISNHWFLPGTAKSLPKMISDQTFIVHWYNSVESRFLKEPLTRDWLSKHEDSAIAELVRRFC